MPQNQYTPDQFMATEKFLGYSPNVKNILEKLMAVLKEEGVYFIIKTRKGPREVITLALANRSSANIATILVYREHIQIKGLNVCDRKVESPDDIFVGDTIADDILEKYYQLSRKRKQYSMYVYSDIIDKLETKAVQTKKTINEMIENILEAATLDIFISGNHRNEFLRFVKNAGIINTDSDVNRKKVATFYLLSAYQNYYYAVFDTKFSYDSTNDSLMGPENLFNDALLHTSNAETTFILTTFLCMPKLCQFQILDIWEAIYACDDEVSHLANVALKILGGQYILEDNEIKPRRITYVNEITIQLNDEEE